MKTPLCNLLKIELPIIQAPIGSATNPELTAAISNSGGLGMLSMTWRTEAEVRQLIRQTKALTDRPFGVNFVLEFEIENQLKICLAEGIKIISLFWGTPEPYIDWIHQAGGIAIHSVGDTIEAIEAKRIGVDVVVAQGWESGGHVRGNVSTITLVPAVVDAVAPLPVVAAGGIADGRGILAALALGASGVWLETRFLSSYEAAIHQIYRQKLLEAKVEDTVYSTVFDLGWKNAPHRTLTNSTIQMWKAAGQPQSGDRPKEGEILGYTATGEPIIRYSDTIPRLNMQGNLEALALYAGQSVGLINDAKPSAEIMAKLVEEVELNYQHLKDSLGW